MELNLFRTIRILICLMNFTPLIYCEPPMNIVVGRQNQELQINSDCEQYEILTNYKHIFVLINNIKNIDKVLITDKPLANCNVKECQGDSNICQSR
jgi:hypothetical protein